MTHVIRAVYENGIFKPLDAPDLPEHQQVRLTVEEINAAGENVSPSSGADPLAGIRQPTGIPDLAEHFDDYRFGRRQS